MNRNTIYQGDCLRLLPRVGTETVDLILTDPPYGIRYSSRNGTTVAGDRHPYIWWLHEAARVLKEDGGLLCFCRWDVLDAWRTAIQFADLTVRSCIVWDKQSHGMGNTKQAFAPKHELCLWATKKGFAFPAGRPADVIADNKVPSAHMVHPTQKPVKLMASLIETTTKPGALVLDPFAGSCTTAVAAIQTGRDYICMELERGYCNEGKLRVAQLLTTD